MAAIRSTMRYIDSGALMHALESRNLIPSIVSEELGHSKSFLTTSCNRGILSVAAINGLKYNYRINPDIYVLQEPPKSVSGVSKMPENDKLYEIIFSAVRDGVIAAFNSPSSRDVGEVEDEV